MMVKKIVRILFFSIIVSLAAIFQVSAIFVWSGFFGELNLVLLLLVMVFFFFDFKTALLACFLSGFWLDLFSFSFFGFYIINLLLTLLLVEWISVSWLTNRSFYSFLLINILALISYNFSSGLLFYFFNFEAGGFFLFQASFWISLAYQALWSLIIVFLTFNLSALVTKKLRPVFLGSKLLEKS
jgi:hypothetical protein